MPVPPTLECCVCKATFPTRGKLIGHQKRICAKEVIESSRRQQATGRKRKRDELEERTTEDVVLSREDVEALSQERQESPLPFTNEDWHSFEDAADFPAGPSMDSQAAQREVEAEQEALASASGRPVRSTAGLLPLRFRDAPPEVPSTRPRRGDLLPLDPEDLPAPAFENIRDRAAAVPPATRLRTTKTSFGTYSIVTIYDPSTGNGDAWVDDDLTDARHPYGPYPNWSSYAISRWFWLERAKKSLESFQRLVAIMTDGRFRNEDLREADFKKIHNILKDKKPGGDLSTKDRWITFPLTINVPVGHLGAELPDSIEHVVDNFRFRPIVGVMEAVLSSPDAKNFCFNAMEVWYEPPSGGPRVAVSGEAYWSPVFRRQTAEVQTLPREAGDDLPRAVAMLMFHSDGMAATSFGNLTLWPIYMWFGNQSKYEVAKPSSRALQEIGHLPHLRKVFDDMIHKLTGGKKIPPELLTYCKRLVMQAAWDVLLGEDFQHAWQFGVVINCGDGVRRRIYPRIFTYSADYPEKILLATIKYLGTHPCHLCLVKKDDIPELGTESDMTTRVKRRRIDNPQRRRVVRKARRQIYKKRRRLNHKKVQERLKSKSLTPVPNAFSNALFKFGFNFYDMLAPDVMHELESGVGKAVFTHALRMLEASDPDAITEFDHRMRLVPAFGTDIIRKFNVDVSEMKQMTAFNFEDIMQCVMPVFDGLLDEPLNSLLLDVLYDYATLHAYAKSRIHTTATVDSHRLAISTYGSSLRALEEASGLELTTMERAAETRKRYRRKVNSPSQTTLQRGTAVLVKKQNMRTIKLHFAGHLCKYEIEYGPSDLFSTCLGESQHKVTKDEFSRTNRVDPAGQITAVNRVKTNIYKVDARVLAFEGRQAERDEQDLDNVSDTDEELEEPTDAPTGRRYWISGKGTQTPLREWLAFGAGDPALANFIPLLKTHLLARVRGVAVGDIDEQEYPLSDTAKLRIIKNKIYTHAKIQVYYTTYDLQRKYDSINPRSNTTDVMVLSADDDEEQRAVSPFWYARVLGIFHAFCATDTDPTPRQIDFLWVRWFGRASEIPFGDEHKRLEHLTFLKEEDGSPPFGFIDPSRVVRAIHIIPAFKYGRTSDILGPSPLARGSKESCRSEEDWAYYVVNKFADRDIFMHHRGGGVGHTTGFRSAQANEYTPEIFEILGCEGHCPPPEDDDRDAQEDAATDSEQEIDSDNDRDLPREEEHGEL